MTWSTYAAFAAFSAVLVLVPGPDVAIVIRNALAGGPVRGRWTAVGVAGAAAVQGVATAFGLGALVLASRPLFETIRWLGVAYLAWLGLQALRSAWRGVHPPVAVGSGDGRADARLGLRQGAVCNFTNPKVLAFYLAVLPQFLPAEPTMAQAALLALTHAALSLGYLLGLAAAVRLAAGVLARQRVRRSLDGVTGIVLLGFAGRLALELA